MRRKITVDAVMAAERAASFTRRSIKSGAKRAGLLLALAMLDLTTLEGKDSPERVRALCRKALRPDPADPSLPSVAAVCVYPALVAVAKRELAGSQVKIASVATGFPSGQYPLDVRLEDVRRAFGEGADEIDMVISRGEFLAGGRAAVADEIHAVRHACGPAALKVILETGELETLDLVREASDLAIEAIAAAAPAGGPIDFIKTSTGKVQPAATMPVTLVMLEAVRDAFARTGRVIGVKPAGGIRTAKQALHYLVMVRETMGPLTPGAPCPWLTPGAFRFGASALANDILRQLRFGATGRYAAAYDVTEG